MRNSPGELVSLNFVVHVGHLVSDTLKPCLQRLGTSNHSRKLTSDDSKLVERLSSECSTLRSPPVNRPYQTPDSMYSKI